VEGRSCWPAQPLAVLPGMGQTGAHPDHRELLRGCVGQDRGADGRGQTGGLADGVRQLEAGRVRAAGSQR
jgi:hypothetical protein